MKLKAIRRGEDFIEIDQQKGEWPFVRAQTVDGYIALYIDCNKGGQIVGEGHGLAQLHLTKKKARALRDFLNEELA